MKKVTALLLVFALFAALLPMAAMADRQYKSGDIVTFGNYEQDNNTQNGTEPIKWIVLGVTKDEEKVVLLSYYCLDCVQFNDESKGVTWEDSSLRQWLNETFLEEAFSWKEQTLLEPIYSEMCPNPQYGTSGGNSTSDYVTLLSIEEAEALFKDDEARRCDATAYAKRQGVQVYSTGAWWRLRSPGQFDTSAASVYASGQIAYAGDSMWDYGCGIRPMIMVNIA